MGPLICRVSLGTNRNLGGKKQPDSREGKASVGAKYGPRNKATQRCPYLDCFLEMGWAKICEDEGTQEGCTYFDEFLEIEWAESFGKVEGTQEVPRSAVQKLLFTGRYEGG
ncbi:hypothetical protein L873DRAFT_1803472 [Choiromyces venosus 120613-1]|uniref:Uncharacterized protein n=1 Tax=Choiromyces venosus 120613-1 TaxID=1336337 RepID=A0A3N4JZT1_9PEZI|nr:hypothetical protein L873DRAFT_1803472 [Choiromyces venosus 120613-1]